MNNSVLTQHYSTWGDKLLQHTDVLSQIQNKRYFSPITVQLAPTETCDSDCPFCSVANQPMGKIPFKQIQAGLKAFRELGAKSVEITGGGNPLLYRDSVADINDIVSTCSSLGYKIGIITNSEMLSSRLTLSAMAKCAWIRVSLAKLDEGIGPEDYNFTGAEDRLGFSYIMHAQSAGNILQQIAELVDRWPTVKFVRIAPDCLTEDSKEIEHRIGQEVAALDRLGKFFIKEIGDNFHPYPGGCWVGMIRPYWTFTGIYICTSHVLQKRAYLPEYRLCGANEIKEAWMRMNANFTQGRPPYSIDISKCEKCYFANNNKILSTIIHEIPDKEFA